MAARGAGDAQQPLVQGGKLDNATGVSIDTRDAGAEPAVATIYQLDGIVRRAPSLQLTADARMARQASEVAA